MSDFDAAFQPLKAQLDDPDALFHGQEMVDALLALGPLAVDAEAQARLYRELAVLEGKRDELACLDHADTALDARTRAPDALDHRALFFMHAICGSTGMRWRGGPRAAMHLDRAIALHPVLDRPAEELLSLRMDRAIWAKSEGQDRHGLDRFEPLLTDAEAHYGVESIELAELLRLVGEAHQAEGDMDPALAFKARSVDLLKGADDPGRHVSGLVGLAGMQIDAEQPDAARASLTAAIIFADTHCSPSTQSWARDRYRDALGEAAP